MGGKPRRRQVFFAPSDGWLLAAAALATRNGCARWRQIVGMADYVDHAIPTYDELAGAVARFHASGLARRCRDGLEVAPHVLRALDPTKPDLRGRSAAIWTMAEPTPDQPPSVFALRLRREDYDTAVRIHLDWG